MSETRQSLTVPGSRWWKIDFHTHSPASNDYKKKDATVNNWLKAAMTAGLDGVVLTDHNSGDWIDKLKAQNEILCQQSSKSDWYHELTIFPGVEITVADSSSRIHLLAVFAPNYGSSEITAILGACGITSGFGDETLIIDQPEDDLDNALVYDLIVNQIHKNKDRRQLIIATHNPNIVVNGDSELVHVLKFTGGQIRLDRQGGLEEIPVRESICTIMEGGKKAFEQRYRRIALKGKNHV